MIASKKANATFISDRLSLEQVEAWLREDDPERLNRLWKTADAVRQKFVGNAVHLRGLIEISNRCVRHCGYCGLRAANTSLKRYGMSDEEIAACARKAADYGYGTVVLQAGEDPALGTERVAGIVREIKRETPLAVTLSLGEREDSELRLWRESGADRYLLRFETGDRELYRRIHPGRNGELFDRIAMLKTLRLLGYETGSGVMIGIPGQTYASLARDLLTFRDLDLDMIGVGPFIPHPDTPLGRGELPAAVPEEQVPATESMGYKAIALTRCLRPDANIPSTTALATINQEYGREFGLTRGANVVMPNVTPPRYRELYEIYPAKACLSETAEHCSRCMRGRIASIGREIGRGPGNRRHPGPSLSRPN